MFKVTSTEVLVNNKKTWEMKISSDFILVPVTLSFCNAVLFGLKGVLLSSPKAFEML